MVNENLINLANNKKPTELVQELKDYEIKTSKLSPAVRARVINKSGSNYVSEDGGSYGPCIINGQLNYDDCHCSSEELDRQLKIIRNKRELEAPNVNRTITFEPINMRIIFEMGSDAYFWTKADWDNICKFSGEGTNWIQESTFRWGRCRWTRSITVNSISRLRELIKRIEGSWDGDSSDYYVYTSEPILRGRVSDMVDKMKRLLMRLERGENVSGSYNYWK